DFLYQISLTAGLGSNDIGLDRNQLGGTYIVHFERRGPKVFMVVPNLDYVAITPNVAEQQSVKDAFASGVMYGFAVAAQTGERVLVDATSFVVRDAHGAADSLRSQGQGSFKVDDSRSAPYKERTKAFPRNTEMEAMLTLTSDAPGGIVRSVASLAGSFTLRERHSFIQLPEPGFEPRLNDPRSGYFGPSFLDYSSPIGSDMRVRYISRHRLEKVDPSAAVSDPVKPIIYYLDNGTPEPIRTALLEGARWWNEAFEAAGYRNAFQVEVLPDGADPLDVRYNIINWVHRSTRGWSYGSSITDPRTGEILKGHVLLGSLRVRQDYLIAQGLLNQFEPSSQLNMTGKDLMLEMALARIRQLSAHEVGHTLGIQHNFAASVNDRASVMDYPAPLAKLDPDGRILLHEAYDEGIGAWDTFTIRYGYSDFPDQMDEKTALRSLIDEYVSQGLGYITDGDARAEGGAHPEAHLWDNGNNVVEALKLDMMVREVALKRFGVGSLRPDQPMATLEEVLVPLYLRHRYQIEAVSKLIGGVSYTYNLRGDSQSFPTPVSTGNQRSAINALLSAVTPEALALPDQIRTQIPPRPPGFGSHRELFSGHTGLIFDPYAPAAVVAQQVFGLLLHSDRMARLTYQNDFDTTLPELLDVLVTVTEKIWLEDVPRDGYKAELQRLTQQVWVDQLLSAASSPSQAPAAQARILYHLRDIHTWLTDNADQVDDQTRAHRFATLDEIDRYIFRPYQVQERPVPVTTPPGSPIGSDDPTWLVRTQERKAWLTAWTDATQICAFEN
ncbi:MAG: zinc-dependent metalloprotease, partial [Bacteroidetes bacterium]|nr:zinc-dependent metalloprotease [Bacteroidota bacterium]